MNLLARSGPHRGGGSICSGSPPPLAQTARTTTPPPSPVNEPTVRSAVKFTKSPAWSRTSSPPVFSQRTSAAANVHEVDSHQCRAM
ncbi:hypothetical protein MTP99_001288 [Tenebrio molitor]|nr:hypothetical protein MTP99_001288 [Tenebrio molitor]